MELVKERTKPLFSGPPTSGLITFIGDSKVGKSSLLASFPDSLVISMEAKRTDRIPYGRIQNITNLEEFGEVMELIMADDSIRTVGIDTIDSLQGWLKDDIGITRPTPGVDSRAQWADYTDRIKSMVNYWRESDKLFVVAGHRRAAVQDSDGRVTKAAGLNVSGQGGDYIIQQSEAVGFIGTRVVSGVTQNYLSFKATSDGGVWRSGIEEIRDKEVVLSRANPYSSFASMFGKKEAPAVQLKEKKK
jgi:hypothetical protein